MAANARESGRDLLARAREVGLEKAVREFPDDVIAAVDDAFRDADVLLTASAMDPACRIDDANALSRTYSRQARSPFNLTGHPAIGLMCGLSKTGMPLSVQLVGRAHDEVTLLRAAAAYERASEWHTRRPPL